MAWTAPMTAASNAIWTSAQWNTHVRDNLNETMVAKATTAGRHFVTTGANAIAERAVTSANVATSETTTSTSYTNLTTSGPSVTVTTGAKALVLFSCKTANSLADTASFVSFDVGTATTIAASDTWCHYTSGVGAAKSGRAGMARLVTTLNSGSNVFTMKYRVFGGTGTFQRRDIAVIAF